MMNALEYNKKIELHFSKWQSKPIFNGIDHSDRFIKDGVVCPEKWFSQKVRPLYFFKEAYTEAGENAMNNLINDHLRIADRRIDKMWERVSVWTRGLMQMHETSEIPSFSSQDKIRYYGNEYLEQIAVINIKKSSGAKKSEDKDLDKYAKYDAEEIYEQLVLCDPTIIICGYTGRFVIDLLDIKCKTKEPVTQFDNDHYIYKYEFNGHGLAVICYWHPANQFPDMLNYYGLMHILKSVM